MITTVSIGQFCHSHPAGQPVTRKKWAAINKKRDDAQGSPGIISIEAEYRPDTRVMLLHVK
jgi:hypothetical protein